MGAMERRKGMRGELEVVEILKADFPSAARRASGEESQADQGRDLKGTPGLCVQVQLTAGPTTPLRKLMEAECAAREGEIPLAFVRRDRTDWYVAIRPHHLLAILRRARLTPGDATDGPPGI